MIYLEISIYVLFFIGIVMTALFHKRQKKLSIDDKNYLKVTEEKQEEAEKRVLDFKPTIYLH